MARPLSFFEFCAKLGGEPRTDPEPGQRAMLAVAFEGQEPEDAGELAERIYRYKRGTPKRARDVVVFVAGGRGGKTFWSGRRMLHLACTVDVSRLAPGEHGYVFLVAPKLDLAGQVLNYIKGAIAATPQLAARCTINADEVIIDRGRGKLVTIQTVAASRGGAGQRGRSLLGALLDETAFFRDESTGVVNDQALFSAIAPRVIEGGQIVVQSTPWAKSGLLYELYKANFGRPEGALVAQAPTALLRTDEKILSYVAREYARDPENARIEFGAEFGSASSTMWLDPDALERAVSGAPHALIAPGDELGAGGDLGFSRNSSALVVARRRAGKIDLVLVDERRPEDGKPLRPSKVCQDFAQQLRAVGAEELVADRHYQETAREALDEADLLLSPPPPPDEAWAVVRQLLRDGCLTLPAHAALLRQQLAGVRGKLGSGGAVTITLPQTPDGRHGDLAAACALACWAVVRRPTLVKAPPARPGTTEALQEADEARLERWAAERQAAREREQFGACPPDLDDWMTTAA